MLTLELGTTYRFTLISSKNIDIVVHGSNTNTDGAHSLDITVDGIRGTHKDINNALGEGYIKMARIS